MKNAHDIAIDLERDAGDILGCDFNHSGTFFDADEIHARYFYEAMHLMLHMRGNDGSIDFLNRICDECHGKNMDDIPNCRAIYEEFRTHLER